MFTNIMYERLVEDLKKEQTCRDNNFAKLACPDDIRDSIMLDPFVIDSVFNEWIEIHFATAKKFGCTKEQAEEAAKVLSQSVQDIIDRVWNDDYESEPISDNRKHDDNEIFAYLVDGTPIRYADTRITSREI